MKRKQRPSNKTKYALRDGIELFAEQL
jgi:hypothetical protein